jgi:hypothetical protein
MSTEMDSGRVENQLRREFELMGIAPGLVTAEVVAAGRRRKRNRLLTVGVASIAVLTAAAIVVPAVLYRPAPTVATEVNKPLTWTKCMDRDLGPPPDRRLWLGSMTNARLKVAVDAALEKASPGAKYSGFEVGRVCPYLEQGANVILNVTRADGVKGSIEIDLSGALGTPAARADAAASTRTRDRAPLEVPANKPIERRSLGDGVEAVVYPKGAHFWRIPVSVFAPGNLNIEVSASAWRRPTGDKVEPEVYLEPKDSPFSIEQMLTIGKALGALAPKSVPAGPVRVAETCETTPPAGHAGLTSAGVQTALLAELAKIEVRAKFARGPLNGVCWPSVSNVALTGADPLHGIIEEALVFSRGGTRIVVSVEVSLRRGPAAERAAALARTGDRMAAGFHAPLRVEAAYRGEVRVLDEGSHAVVYPRGTGFWQLPVDVLTDRQVNIAVYVSGQYRSNVTPADAPLTTDQMLQIGKAIAALDR